MVVEALLTLAGAPHFNTLLDEPLDHKRCLVIASAQAVEHENQQYIELVQYGALFDFYNSIARIGADLVAGHAFFADLIDNFPVRVRSGIFPACLALHRNIVVINLSDGGNTVKANHPFHHVHPFRFVFISILSTSEIAVSSCLSA